MKRLAISFFYDGEGVLDDYMVVLLQAMRTHCERIVFVVNGRLTDESRAKVEPIVDEILMRGNEGFDVGAYKAGLDHVGFTAIKEYDEVILFNHTFFGPIFPFSEMFDEMEARSCDIWGITAHKEVAADKTAGQDFVPYHLNSHFIAFRQPVLKSRMFANYWRALPVIRSYEESIQLHELKVTQHFLRKGFTVDSYVDPEDYGAPYAAFMEIDRTIEARSPILKRRALFHDPMFVEEQAVDVPRALELVERTSDYDIGLIWQNITRAAVSRTLYTNASLLRVLPSVRLKKSDAPPKVGRIAVFAHAHYDDLVPELLEYAAHIPGQFDFICTTTDKKKKARILAACEGNPKIGKAIVRVVGELCGRDMAALLVTCGDLLNSGDYDLICRLHTKKSPQVDPQKGARFKRHMLNNTVGSEGFVANVLDMFESNPRLGIAAPAMYHFGYPTPGHAWFINKQRAVDVAVRMGIPLYFDDLSPIAIYGGMFWFRPAAMTKMFKAGWTYDDFEKEPHPIDGALAHALERLWVNVAADAGYVTNCILDTESASVSHTLLEYKLDRLAGLLPTGDFRLQVDLLTRAQSSLRGYFFGEARHSRREMGAEFVQLIGDMQNELTKQKEIIADQASRMGETLIQARAMAAMPAAAKVAPRVSEAARDLQVLADYFEGLKGAQALAASEFPTEGMLAKYLAGGFMGDSEVLWAFDGNHYLAAQPDVAAAGKNPLVHFVEYGWSERRNPHGLIDLSYMDRTAPDLVGGDLPLAAYLRSSQAEPNRPHVLFDGAYYASQVEDGLDGPALKHFLTKGSRTLRPHVLFDPVYYLDQAPWLAKTASPLHHYMTVGWKMGLKPHPHFDPAFYLAAYGDVAEAGIEPLGHYLQFGYLEDRNPNEGFGSAAYRTLYGLSKNSDLSPLEHAMGYGR